MKTATTIFLLVLMVSIQTPVGQLFKFPILIEHFLKHQEKNGDSLSEFLTEHYSSDHKDADWPEDQQLPFKNFDFYSIGNAVMPLEDQAIELIALPIEKKIIFPNCYTPQQHLASIFHPPRV